MHIIFQQNWISKSVKTMYTIYFQKIVTLHKSATCYSSFKKLLLSDMHAITLIPIYMYMPNGTIGTVDKM